MLRMKATHGRRVQGAGGKAPGRWAVLAWGNQEGFTGGGRGADMESKV